MPTAPNSPIDFSFRLQPARDLIRAPLRPAAATCRFVQWDCRQLLDRDCLVFDRLIKRLRIAGPKAAHTLRVCGIELALGGANRLSAGGEIHCWGRIACGAKVVLFSAAPGRFRPWFVVGGHPTYARRRRRCGRKAALGGFVRGVPTVHSWAHRRQRQCIERVPPRSRVTLATPTQTELAAHSGQGDFIGCLQRNSLYRAEIGTGRAGGAAPGPSIALWGTLH